MRRLKFTKINHLTCLRFQFELGFKSRSASLSIPNFHSPLGPSAFKKSQLFHIFKPLLLAFSIWEPNFLLFTAVLLKPALLYVPSLVLTAHDPRNLVQNSYANILGEITQRLPSC